MKYAILLVALLLSCGTYAQDIKTKKNIVLLNEAEWLSKDKGDLNVEKTKCVLSSVKSGKPLFSIYIRYYVEVGKAKMDINFVDFDGSCRLTTTVKDIYRNLYKMGAIDADGVVNRDKAEAWIRLYNEKSY